MHQSDTSPKKIQIFTKKHTSPLKALISITWKLLVVKAIVTAIALTVIYFMWQLTSGTRLNYDQLEMLGNIIFMILFLHEVVVLGLEPYLNRKAERSRDEECEKVLDGFNLKMGFIFEDLPVFTNLDDQTVKPNLITAYSGLQQSNKRFILLDFKNQPVSSIRIKQPDGTLSEPYQLQIVKPEKTQSTQAKPLHASVTLKREI